MTASAQGMARPIGYEARWDEERWGGPPQVVVTMDNGELRYVEQIAAAALAVLEAEMTRLKIGLRYSGPVKT